ncbi:MAG: ShlB/FhaC/HecB family hemolysin secretion/activation protein [Verrucomicrobiota bacterium]
MNDIYLKLNIFVICIAVLLNANFLYAQDEQRILPREIQTQDEPPEVPQQEVEIVQDATVLVDELKALVFVGNEQAVSPTAIQGEGVVIRDVAILDDENFRNRIRPYIGQPVSLALLYEVAQETILFYRDKDRPVVDVFAPQQDISNGVIQMVAVEGRVGEVYVQGNKWFSSKVIRSQVSLRTNAQLRISRINQDLKTLNQNPFRYVDVVFTPGTEDGTTDVILQTQDRFPVRFYTGWEDTGNDLTGDERWIFGFNWGDAFFLDHQMNYQFTSSSDFDMLTAHSGSYMVPLPWAHNVSLYGSYAESNAEVPGGTSIGGSSWQVGMRYTVPLPDIKTYNHELVFGYEFKQSNNLTDVAGLFELGSLNDVSQFIFEYGASLPDSIGGTSLTLIGVWSPGGMTGLNDDLAFRTSRDTDDTQADYAYFKVNAERIFKLPWEFTSVHSFTFQIANANLLASEQLSVGGYYSVRGYDERELSDTDEGWLMRHELRTPSISVLDLLGLKKVEDELQFLGFWDYADVSPYEPLPGQSDSESLSSVGAGLRYSIAPYLSIRADYGFQLTDVPGTDSRYNDRWHLGMLLSY